MRTAVHLHQEITTSWALLVAEFLQEKLSGVILSTAMICSGVLLAFGADRAIADMAGDLHVVLIVHSGRDKGRACCNRAVQRFDAVYSLVVFDLVLFEFGGRKDASYDVVVHYRAATSDGHHLEVLDGNFELGLHARVACRRFASTTWSEILSF